MVHREMGEDEGGVVLRQKIVFGKRSFTGNESGKKNLY